MHPEWLAQTATVMGAFWGLSAGISHLSRLSEFRRTVGSFRVLPHRFVGPYAHLAVASLLLGGAFILVPAPPIAYLGGALLVFVFLTFSAGSLLAARSQDQSRKVSCGCLGGYLSSDLTPATWILPAGIAATIVVGMALGPPGAAQLINSEGFPAVAVSAALSTVLVLVVEAGATWYRRQLWLRYRVRAQ